MGRSKRLGGGVQGALRSAADDESRSNSSLPWGSRRRFQVTNTRSKKARLELVAHLPAGPFGGAAVALGVHSVAVARSAPVVLAPCPATLVGIAIASRAIVTTVEIRMTVGVGATPVATPQRIQAPQPLPRGRLGGKVHLPTGTTGVGSFAPRAGAQLGNLTSTRLGSRQPRPKGRLVDPLQLPLRDDPTTITSVPFARFRWSR